MAQIIVRSLDDEVKRRLQERAERHGKSMEEEVRDILGAAVARDATGVVPLGTAITARFAAIGLDEPLPEMHGQNARAAQLDP